MGLNSGRGPPIIAVPTTEQYRKMVPVVVTAEDTVLEVGSANGVTCEVGLKKVKSTIRLFTNSYD